MLSREDRILSEILLARGLVERERLEARARERGAPDAGLADALVEAGDISRDQAREAADEARALDASLAPDLPAGKELGEFRLLREIGRGGMGIVYEAEQQGLDRRVALKLLPAGAALDGRLAIRFLREARAAAKLRHPGIVPVYASGHAEGVLYYAMELVQGRTLEALLANGPLDPPRAARIAADVARALDHAHRAGLVHRDVKPGNVLISPDGAVRLTDFGLVLEASSSSLTLSRHVLGTPAFVAPEQIRGERADPRCDVYAVGAVLYAMLGGRPPFEGNVPALVLARALTARPADLAALRPGLPPRLVAICQRAMARDPAARHPSAAALADELEELLRDGTPAVAQRVPARRARLLVPGLAAGAAVTALAAAWVLIGGGGSTATPAAAGPTLRPLLQTPGHKISPALSPDGRLLAYAGDVDGDWDIYLTDLSSGATENLTPDSPGEDRTPAFSSDGRSLAYLSSVDGRPWIAVLDLATRRVHRVVERPASRLRWSADDRELVFSDRLSESPGRSATPSKLLAVELATGRLRTLTGMYGSQPDVSAVAASITFVQQGGGRTDVWRLADSGEAVRVTDDEALEWSPVWSLDGDEIFFGGDRGGVGRLFRVGVEPAADGAVPVPRPLATAVFPSPFYLARAATRRELALIGTRHDGRIHRIRPDATPGAPPLEVVAFPERFLAADAPDVSPDGRLVAFTAITSRQDVAISDVLGAAPHLVTDDAFEDRAPRWSPDGERIAFESDRAGPTEIWTVRPDGTDLRRLTRTQAGASGPVWSPDGARLAFRASGAGAFVVPVEGDGAAEPLPPPDGAAFEPSSWSPDGDLLAGTAGGVVVYSFATGSYRRLTDAGAGPVWLDDRRLAFAAGYEVRVVDLRSRDERVLVSLAPARVSQRIGLMPDRESLVVSLSVSSDTVWVIDPDAGAALKD